MSDFKCPMCTDCPDNCPLDTEEDTREHSADFYKGKADGAREFAEWLVRKNGYLDLFGNDSNELLAEWQKEEE